MIKKLHHTRDPLIGLEETDMKKRAVFNALRRLLAESQVELDALLPSVLDRAFKGELQL